jgi:hypothetical protein
MSDTAERALAELAKQGAGEDEAQSGDGVRDMPFRTDTRRGLKRKELTSDPKVARLSINIQKEIARKQLEKTVRSELSLPSREDWCGDSATSQ